MPLHISAIYQESANVPVCTDGSVSVELIVWEHMHILTDTVLACVLMCVGLHMRTPRNTGIPGFIVLHRSCIF